MDTRPEQDAAAATARLVEVVDRLRSEGGCPWDRGQTLESLKPGLIEESYEVLDAIDSGDPGRHAEELGDLLLQVLMQSRIREEQGAFSFRDVAERLREKLVRRHPHVFGDVKAEDGAEALRNWEAIKAREKPDVGEVSALGGIPLGLPALQKAQRAQGRAARVGFDWPDAAGAVAKVEEEIGELRRAMEEADPRHTGEEIGDVLFSLVNLSRFLGVDAEEALRRATDKFMRRFREVERRMRQEGRAMEPAAMARMDEHWETVKAQDG